jgi:uncharacterized membrane protein YbhN (UPF0104 family)
MKRAVLTAVAWCLLLLSAYWTVTQLRWGELTEAAKQLIGSGWLLALMFAGYAAAFWLRSLAWAIQIGDRRASVKQLWLYHHVGLLLNHLLPVKGGEVARAALLKRFNHFSWGEALVFVTVNRLMDIAGLVSICAIALMLLAPEQVKEWFQQRIMLSLLLMVFTAAVLRIMWRFVRWKQLPFVARLITPLVNKSGWLSAYLFTLAGWMLEAVVVWSVAASLDSRLGIEQALLVHVLTIIGQVFHVTPGGVGTYEAVMSALLHQVALYPLAFALQVAILSHIFKFVYSFLLGGYAAWRLSLSPLQLFRQAKRESKEGKK